MGGGSGAAVERCTHPPNLPQALVFIKGHYIDAKPFSAVLLRVQRFCMQRDRDANSYCDRVELRELFVSLGVVLSDAEFDEACTALNTSGDNRIHIPEVVAWLSQA